MRILVLNAGSSSIKFAVFNGALEAEHAGALMEIGGASELTVNGAKTAHPVPNHIEGLKAIFEALKAAGLSLSDLAAAAHRVVHGGPNLAQPMRITPEVRAEIESCSPLAPLHNPHNLAAIDAVSELAPNLPQFASFDTSFHATNPEPAIRYGLPDVPETTGIRRYGFHGLSYASLTRLLPEISGTKLPHRLLAFHLGNGASLCAIKGGKSIATTMGYSPLDGLTMGTRCGGIDANAVLKMVEDHGLERVKSLLNHRSGLFGLSGGVSDMRRLMIDPSATAAFAVDHFCYWSLRHAGSLIAAMGGLDAIAFTGGIGENAVEVRRRLLTGLDWLGVVADLEANASGGPHLTAPSSGIDAWIIPAREEEMIARDALRILS